MMLYFAPMWGNDDTLFQDDIELFEWVWNYIHTEYPLDVVFDSYKIMNPIKIPRIDELSKSFSTFQKIMECFPTFTNFLGYGDSANGYYTLRFMMETAEKMRWDDIDGRIYALTNVSLKKDQYSAPMVCSKISKKASLVSIRGTGDDPRQIYKASKTSLGHTFGLSVCDEESCVMNTRRIFADRGEQYCESCTRTLLENYRQEGKNRLDG